MNKIFVDTNLFLRFLTNDIPEQAALLENLILEAAAGKQILVTNTMVIAEIVWTLQTFYNCTKRQIDDTVSSIVAADVFDIEERDIILQALEDFHTLNIDFIDAYLANWMKEHSLNTIATLNRKDFRRYADIDVTLPARR